MQEYHILSEISDPYGRPGLIAELHENAGTLILIRAGLQAFVALWRHFIRRDGTLRA